MIMRVSKKIPATVWEEILACKWLFMLEMRFGRGGGGLDKGVGGVRGEWVGRGFIPAI
jgi:hypothetical protein